MGEAEFDMNVTANLAGTLLKLLGRGPDRWDKAWPTVSAEDRPGGGPDALDFRSRSAAPFFSGGFFLFFLFF